MDFIQLKQLFTDEDAVSPVIGVILMVAITVILAAVIGTFVLGLGENVQDSAPQANFQFEYVNTGDATVDNDKVSITHTGGEDVDLSTVSVIIGSATVYDSSGLVADQNADANDELQATNSWTDPISTGDTQDIEEIDNADDDDTFGNGDTVRVIWTSPSGGQSQTIGQSQVPN